MNDNTSHKGNTTILLGTITTTLEALIQIIEIGNFKPFACALLPITIAVGNMVVKTCYKRYIDKDTMKSMNGWIDELKSEIADPNTSITRRKKAREEMDKYKSELRQLQLDFKKIVLT